MKTIKELLEEIDLLVTYGAPEDEVNEAKELITRFQADRIALNLCHHFYSFLPEGLNDRIRDLRLLDLKEGNFLLLARAGEGNYCYIVNPERAEFLGNFLDGICDQEVLDYFKVKSRHYQEKFPDPEEISAYQPLEESKDHCMACTTKSGDYHRPGCPVEVCPWCAGQLTRCNCRFRQLGVTSFTSEAQLDQFLELLDKKGRIPFDLSQQPGRGSD